MGRLTGAAVVAAATAAGAVAAHSVMGARQNRSRRAGVQHAITVFRPLDEIQGNLPGPLAELGDAVEVRMRPAPGDRGTEIFVRSVDGRTDPGTIRRALRTSRSVLEVGDVLEPGGPTTKPTLLNRPLRAVTARGREEGLL
jgi:hypothetical protein